MSSKQEFINSVKDGAIQGYKDYGILPSLTIAQAILESGWGTTQLATKAKNLFGIKAFSDWKGKKITMKTTEWYNGVKTTVNADFRAYDSYNESIMDHNKLLSYSRYTSVRQAKDYKSACEAVYKCGYATDPEYAPKLIRIIEQYKLYEYDNIDENYRPIEPVEEKKEDTSAIELQKALNRLKVHDEKGNVLVEDGIIGSCTKSAIKRFQNIVGITVDGIAGPITKGVLKQILDKPLVKQGDKGNVVRYIQWRVGATIDGIFGPKTDSAVRAYQSKNELVADGIVGPKTWAKLIG